MKMMLSTVIVLTALLSTARSMEARYLCGAQLADMLELVCADRGFNWEVSKRSGTEDYRVQNSENISTQKRSVVDECCRQACTLKDLEAYCAPGPGDLDTDYLLERFIQLSPRWTQEADYEQIPRRAGDRPAPVKTDRFRGRPSASRGSATHAGGRQNSRGRPAGIFKNRSYFFVTPARRDYNLPKGTVTGFD